MKILQINTVYGEGSTGKIAKDIHDVCTSLGIECLTAYRCTHSGQKCFEDSVEISSSFDSRVHGVLSRVTMFKGCFSKIKTSRFLKKADNYSPDLIHLHNLHGSYVNLPLLFRYIKKNNIPVVWTLHDCWAFTAICSYFSVANCEKWKTGCSNCPQRKTLSQCPIDNTRIVWKKKKEWFTGINNAVVVTPSEWLAELAKQSFLGEYDIRVINNGIDLSVFKPTVSDFRKKYGLEEKHIVLGVAFDWDYRKGIDVVSRLADELPDGYKVVLVGTNDDVDKRLPNSIISIHRTADQRELAGIYTSADVLINPTREDNFPTVNIEAIACGTPVVTFRTGGSPEILDSSCGIVVEKDDAEAMKDAVVRICEQRLFNSEDCVKRGAMFEKRLKLGEYASLYSEILSSENK